METEFMLAAICEAKKAFDEGEVPVGAVIVKNKEIISAAHNRREKLGNPLSHAETEAVLSAAEKLGDWRLSGCELYVTLEPCPMCAGAIINSRLDKIYFGAYDSSYGSFGSRIDLSAVGYPDKVEVHGGIMEQECKNLLAEFFKNKR